jgi:hypothetical protein
MIRSRPGFSPVVTHDSPRAKSPVPAKLNPDMQPAFAKHTSAAQGAVKSPLKHDQPPAFASAEQMQAQAEAAFKKMQAQAPKVGPEIIVNHAPSATPVITSPHGD